MFANLSTNTICVRNQTLKQLISLAQGNGFGGIDVPAEALTSQGAAEEAAATMSASGLKWGMFWLPADFSNCDDTEFRKGMLHLQKVLPFVQVIGCTRCYNHIWPGSNELVYMANFRKHSSRLTALSDLLGRYGVSLGLEFIGAKTLRDSFRYPFVHTLEETLELADVASPTVGIVLDMYHLYTSGGSIDDLKRHLPVDRIINVHANDAPLGRNREDQMDTEREMPLVTGLVNGSAIVRWLHDAGYEGPIIAEPFFPSISRFRDMTPEAVVQEVGECMRRLLTLSDDQLP